MYECFREEFKESWRIPDGKALNRFQVKSSVLKKQGSRQLPNSLGSQKQEWKKDNEAGFGLEMWGSCSKEVVTLQHYTKVHKKNGQIL